MSDAEREEAHSAGRFVGSLADSVPSMCPYDYHQAELGLAWFDGFSAGRTVLRKQAVEPH